MERFEARITDFYRLILQGDERALDSLFAGEPLVDTPLNGEIRGKASFGTFIHEQKMWLSAREARIEQCALTVSNERVVSEILLYIHHAGDTIDVPVALVADLAGGGASSIRIYHSTWPLTGRHMVRAPIVDPAKGLEEPEIIRRYMAALAKPDKEAVLSLFSADGCVREPSGSRYEHCGADGVRRFYDMALGEGGISLTQCTATFDGAHCAVEYICDGWGGVQFEPQAGMAVYELAGPDRIAVVRIYDDVTSPGESAA
jgi:hypothetical protein